LFKENHNEFSWVIQTSLQLRAALFRNCWDQDSQNYLWFRSYIWSLQMY